MNSDSMPEATVRLGRSAGVAVAPHVVALITAIVAIISDAVEIDLLKDIAAGQYISERIADANDARQVAIAVVLVVAGLIAVVFFFVWLHRELLRQSKSIPARYILDHPRTMRDVSGSWWLPAITTLSSS